MASDANREWNVDAKTMDIDSWRSATGKSWPRFCQAYGCLNAPSLAARLWREEEQGVAEELFTPLCSTCRRTGTMALKPELDDSETEDAF